MGTKLSYPEVDLSGKVVIVTGGNQGVGYETAKALTRLGAHTFIACRSREKAEEAIKLMKKELSSSPDGDAKQKVGDSEEGDKEEGTGGEQTGGDIGNVQDTEAAEKEVKVEFLPLDLSSFQAVMECVRIFKERDLPLHILINNAGVGFTPYRKTGDGFEMVFQVNHLGPTLLTLELLPLLVDTAAASGDGRILFLASPGQFIAPPFDVDKLNKSEEDYRRFKDATTAKLCNVMTGFALQRKLKGKNITVFSVNPGTVKTNQSDNFRDWKFAYYLQKPVLALFGRTPSEGAATSLYCAVNPELNSQQHSYYDSCRPKESSADARNETFQEQLWSKTFEFLKEHLSPEIVEKYGNKPPEAGTEGPGEGESGAEP